MRKTGIILMTLLCILPLAAAPASAHGHHYGWGHGHHYGWHHGRGWHHHYGWRHHHHW